MKVFKEVLPPLLVELVGFEKLLQERIPENYLKAIFSKHLASHYVYEYGSDGNEFSFFEFMQRYIWAILGDILIRVNVKKIAPYYQETVNENTYILRNTH